MVHQHKHMFLYETETGEIRIAAHSHSEASKILSKHFKDFRLIGREMGDLHVKDEDSR